MILISSIDKPQFNTSYLYSLYGLQIGDPQTNTAYVVDVQETVIE